MGRLTRFALILLGCALISVILAGVSLTIFLNGEGLRTRVEMTLTKALARKVTIGNLNLSLWSGSLLAEHMTVADDPRFSSQPFVQAQQVRMGIEVLPLLLRRQVRLDRFVFQSPVIQLLRAADGSWNYSSLGAPRSPPNRSPAKTKPAKRLPDLAVSSIEISNGSITVGLGSEAGGIPRTENRVYEHVDLSVRDFALVRPFPFRIAASLPGDGTVRVSGTAGPINRQDASATTFTAHLEAKHVDLEPSGLVNASSGVSGLLESVTLDLAWDMHQFHVARFLVDSPHLEFVRTQHVASKPHSKHEGSVWRNLLNNLSLDEAKVKIGALTIVRTGGSPARYRQVDAHITSWAQDSWSPFEISAVSPGGGSLLASGRTRLSRQEADLPSRPFDLDARLSVNHLNLATSGFLPLHSAVSGITDLRAQVRWNEQTLVAAGTAHIAEMKLARNGQPSAKPVEVRFAIAQREYPPTGETIGNIQHSTFSLGAAMINVTGNYRLGGPAAAVNLKVEGDALPIDEIESFLPAVGVQLPEGSRLEGGTLTTSLEISGSEPNIAINGPVQLESTRLMGFDLGSKLTSLSKFTNGRIGSATGPGTTIRSLNMELRVASDQIRTDKVAVNIVGLGTATGAGTIGEGGRLNYKMLLKFSELVPAPDGAAGLARSLSGELPGAWSGRALAAINRLVNGPLKNGIPVLIGGTARHPTFTPNLGALLPP